MKPVVYPADWWFRDPSPPIGSFSRQLLAEGDSWFTISTLNLPLASNILFNLEFTQTAVIVSCAYPGDTLQRVVGSVNDPHFDRLLRAPRFAQWWQAILLSAGGNDLIDALQALPLQPDGTMTPRDRRLLLTADEVAQQVGDTGPPGFVSEEGFARLSAYLHANFQELVRRREAGPSAGRPIFMHTYATPTARPSGALPKAPGGWILPALVAYGVPEDHRQPLTEELFGRLRRFLLELDQGSGHANALQAFHVFDSAQLPEIRPAEPDATGLSGDWINEIHLSPDGYKKVGRAFGPWIEGVLATYPSPSNV